MNVAAWKTRTDDLIERLKAERVALEERKVGAPPDELDGIILRIAEIDRALAVLEITSARLGAAVVEVVPLAADLQTELNTLADSIDDKIRSAAADKASMAFLQDVISGGRKIAASLEA